MLFRDEYAADCRKSELRGELVDLMFAAEKCLEKVKELEDNLEEAREDCGRYHHWWEEALAASTGEAAPEVELAAPAPQRDAAPLEPLEVFDSRTEDERFKEENAVCDGRR